MHTSSYLTSVKIPETDRFLLFHTIRGAVDIVHEDVALALKQSDDFSSALLNEAEVETLTRRGYLTDQTPQREQEQAQDVLRLAAKMVRRQVELVFRFPAYGDDPARLTAGREHLDEVFALVEKLAGEDVPVPAMLEIPSAEIDPKTMDSVLEGLIGRKWLIIPRTTIAGLDALRPWLKSENFQQVILNANGSDMTLDIKGISGKIVHFFEHQIYVSFKCDIDDMSAEQLDALLAIRKRVRQKYTGFTLHLVSNREGATSGSNVLAVDGGKLPFINSENETAMATLLRFIVMPGQVNYSPFFRLEADNLTFDLGSDRISYRSAASDKLAEGFEEVRASIGTELSQNPAEVWESARQASQCLSCKCALVCGRDWIRKYGYTDARQCAESFEQRLRQSLPMLLFNLQGNWRPPKPGGEQAAGAK